MASQNGVARFGAKGSTRLVLGLCAAISMLLVGLAGCARRAPGPDECHDLALYWVLGPRARVVQRFGPAAEEAILDRTTKCLTTPYDRELVQCVTTGAPTRRCLAAFEERRRALTVSAAP